MCYDDDVQRLRFGLMFSWKLKEEIVDLPMAFQRRRPVGTCRETRESLLNFELHMSAKIEKNTR